MSDNITKPSNNVKIRRPGAFQPGHTLGKGRPQGSKNNVTIAIEEIGAANALAIFDRVISAATGKLKDGESFDMNAAKMVLDRVAPIRKGARFDIDIPTTITTVAELDKATTAIIELTATGTISLDEAQQLATVMDSRAKSIELNDISKRLDVLEQRPPV